MKRKRILTLKERVSQLEVALRSLKNANNHYLKTADTAYLLDLAARLRALVCSGGPNMTPLLLNLLGETSIQIYLFSLSSTLRLHAQRSVYSIVLGKTWQVFPYSDYVKYTLTDWLNEPYYFSEVDRQHYSRNEVLKRISNTQGGSHYELKVPFLIDKLADVRINNKCLEETMVVHVLRDVAMATYWAGNKLLLLLKQRETNAENTKALLRDLDQEFDQIDKDKPRGAIFLGNERHKVIE